ncbi:ubiquitin carboxyl-terminal hydrolase 15-like [Neolamprologus brichardi]|uniref:ubiquitin carboxyl-terminal hydrolase 15-like n=1 Tax=Neolamprologus brichardi TaxID=32507 RepID=UPI001643C464|nr:ubiquitin carboxyl-terminal hydrolase 15-like [Neolamprologus brichardi]
MSVIQVVLRLPGGQCLPTAHCNASGDKTGKIQTVTRYHGLINQGATCYLNSVLQVLFMTEDFREAVTRFSDESPHSELIDHHLKGLFDSLQKDTANTFEITKKLGLNNVNEQHDAAEYFDRVLNLTSPGASESKLIKHHPDVLILLLKRFPSNYKHISRVKNNSTVKIPYSLQISESKSYELYAVVDHNTQGGHYTATIKVPNEDRWYNFDDTSVTLVNKKMFKEDNSERSPTANLLVYRKKKRCQGYVHQWKLPIHY